MITGNLITPWHWVGFVVVIILFLALDLGVFHKHAHVVSFKEALGWTTVWFILAMAFGGFIAFDRGREEALEYVTGYLIELSLSLDNVFVIALIFSFFRVPGHHQHRVLFWGILGALMMRGIMIGVGVALVTLFHWILYVFGVVLVVSGVKMIFSSDEGLHPEANPIVRLARKFFPITAGYHGQQFLVVENGKRHLTPLMLVLVMVETTDLIFALDSIPAIFGITQKAFIIFTSNVFAILGLRSLYFVLAGAIGYFRFLKIGLSVVLIFIGVKMLLAKILPLSTGLSLFVVGVILLSAMLVSLLAIRPEPKTD